jgi:hypothetical protein
MEAVSPAVATTEGQEEARRLVKVDTWSDKKDNMQQHNAHYALPHHSSLSTM